MTERHDSYNDTTSNENDNGEIIIPLIVNGEAAHITPAELDDDGIIQDLADAGSIRVLQWDSTIDALPAETILKLIGRLQAAGEVQYSIGPQAWPDPLDATLQIPISRQDVRHADRIMGVAIAIAGISEGEASTKAGAIRRWRIDGGLDSDPKPTLARRIR